MRYVHACRSKTKEKRGRTFGSQIVINEYTSFCRWTSPSPLPSVLSVKLLYYITSDDVKTGTPSELEPSSPEFISLLAEVARKIYIPTTGCGSSFGKDFGGQLSCSRVRRQAEGNCLSCHQMRYWMLGLVPSPGLSPPG
ncbi:hypothetical protein DY000_02010537 [Brassica cretica]|uniref:Uncharacterized protein n=1 Tax=Brassica cretica TaxID=69181 RepID=A0ABQ7C6A1_BRACR|nr:hypothetical protein DY000_02010537 [Brassica cretica]